MVRLVFLLVAVLLAAILFWGISFLPKKKLRVDIYSLINSVLYFVLISSLYIFFAEETLGLVAAIAIIVVVGFRRYLSGRWI